MDNNMRTKNLNSLGTEYNIVGPDGQLIRKIKLVQQQDILRSAKGGYEGNKYKSYDDYLQDSKEGLSGFANDPLSVYWYSTTEIEYDLMDIIDVCLEHDYEYVIIELLTEDDLDIDPF
jgi:hypothetical protein